MKFDYKKIKQRHDFLGRKELIIYVPSKEDIILLKAITRRERDWEDIKEILQVFDKISFYYEVS